MENSLLPKNQYKLLFETFSQSQISLIATNEKSSLLNVRESMLKVCFFKMEILNTYENSRKEKVYQLWD